jgi:hypothetical protein
VNSTAAHAAAVSCSAANAAFAAVATLVSTTAGSDYYNIDTLLGYRCVSVRVCLCL